MTLKEFIQRAIEMASQNAVDPVNRTAMEVAAEPLLTTVFGEVGDELAASPTAHHLLRRVKSLNVVDGAVTLPDDVLTEYACESSLYDPADVTKRYSLISWSDLIYNVLDQRLGHFAISGDQLVVVEPDSSYDPDTGPTLTVRFAIPCTPVVPVNITDDIEVSAEVLDRLLNRMAARLAMEKAR